MFVRVVFLLLVSLLYLSCFGSVAHAFPDFGEFEPFEVGMYWKYSAGVDFSQGRNVSGTITFFVLEEVSLLGLDAFFLAAVMDWGYPGFDMFPYIQSQNLFRWPLPAQCVPGVRWVLPSARALGCMPAYGTELYLETIQEVSAIESLEPQPGVPDWLLEAAETGQGKEYVSLKMGEEWSPLEVVAGNFPRALPILYEGSFLSGKHRGVAWAAPEAGWWIMAKGSYQMGRQPVEYYLELTEWGILDSEQVEVEVVSAWLASMSHERKWAESFRIWLESIGYDLP